MGRHRILVPNSLWDLTALLDAFRQHHVKERHIYALYRCGRAVHQTIQQTATVCYYCCCCCCWWQLLLTLQSVACGRSALLKNPDVAYEDIPNMPKAACALLEAAFTRCTSQVGCCCWHHRLSPYSLVGPDFSSRADGFCAWRV